MIDVVVKKNMNYVIISHKNNEIVFNFMHKNAIFAHTKHELCDVLTTKNMLYFYETKHELSYNFIQKKTWIML